MGMSKHEQTALETSTSQTHNNHTTESLSFHTQFNTTKQNLKLAKTRRKAWTEARNDACDEQWNAYNDSIALLHANLQTLLYLVYNLEHCETFVMDSPMRSKIGAVKAEYRRAIEEIWMKDCKNYHSDRDAPVDASRVAKVSFRDKADVIKIDDDDQ
ncbi:hypothetical protein HDU81_001387 [Chytriomyces hyalinus]|nr:hypothetical protein HDU81_001387 [Chytriomyces hyalinus]